MATAHIRSTFLSSLAIAALVCLGGDWAEITPAVRADTSSLVRGGPSPNIAPSGDRTGPASLASPVMATASRLTPAPGRTARPSATPKPRPTPTPTPSPTPSSPPALSACPIFPATNVWNKPIDNLPVASSSATMIAAVGLTAGLHPDFSAAGSYGIPFNIVGAATPRARVRFLYSDESDDVGYPIPTAPLIEGGSDRHLIMVDTNACRLYELYDTVLANGAWTAGSGATWDLGSNALRPDGWTSADAAGLPILAGLVRYDEVAAGAILHALRFTAPATCAGHLYPARHNTGSRSCSAYPPMGLRVRLKASANLSGFGSQAQVVLSALKRYGMILADNGSPWYITGAPDPRWSDDVLHALGQIHGSDLEVVDTSGLGSG
jgi:hypothetical protein